MKRVRGGRVRAVVLALVRPSTPQMLKSFGEVLLTRAQVVNKYLYMHRYIRLMYVSPSKLLRSLTTLTSQLEALCELRITRKDL